MVKGMMRPKPTGFSKDARDRFRDMLKKKKKDKIKDKVKEKLKNKKKTKSTKTGLLSKAGLMPVSTPGGIPKVMSQKTAQKDPPPKRRSIPGKPKDRMPPELLRPKNPPKKFIPLTDGSGGLRMREPRRLSGNVRKAKDSLIKRNSGGSVGSDKQIMSLARKLKPTGRLSTTDLARARAALQKAFKEDRDKLKMRMKGQKPVFKTGTKEKVKGLTQKAGQGKPLTAAQKKQLRKMMDNVSMRMPKATRPKKGMQGMIPLMGSAAKGMRRGFGSKNMKSAAKKMKRIM